MRTRYFVRAGSAALAVLAITIFGTVFVKAQSGAPVGGTNATPTVTVLGNRILQRTAFAANNSNVTTTCGTSGCTASTAVFNQSVVCPQFAGKSCTLYIHLESQDDVSLNDNGLFKFLVDGLPPDPGATDSNGLFRWVLNDPDSEVINFEARSYAVVARVRNRFQNQTHAVQAHIACQDISGDGCTASMGFATLTVGVYTP